MSESGSQKRNPGERGRKKGAARKQTAGKAGAAKARSGRPVPPAALIQALNSRMRRDVLRHYHAEEIPLSPVMVSAEIKLGISSTSYHISVLRTTGALKQKKERQVRGAVEHFYVSTVSDDPTTLALLADSLKEDRAAAKKEGR